MKFNKEQKYSVTTVKSVNTEHKHVHIDVRHGQDSQNITCFINTEHKHVHIDVRHGQDSQNITCFINTFCVLKVWNEQN